MNSEVPKLASQTFMGQKLLKPIVNPIPYTHLKPINQDTVEEFNLNKKETIQSGGIQFHKFNHVDQNKLIASRYRE